METILRVLNVFLASPSDVADERAAAEEAVASINKSFESSTGWHIKLHKWEGTTPEFGRPQAIINRMVDECDLFIGLIWERWGQATGLYSSGFEEEYERAKERRKGQGKPEIWLVFRDIEPSKLKDPGPQLKRVIEFKELQKERREVLFQTVSDASDWKFRLRDWLLLHVLNLSLLSQPPGREQGAVAAIPEPQDSTAIRLTSQSSSVSEASKQLNELSELFGQWLQNEVPEFSATPESPLREFHAARLFLVAATLFSHRYTGQSLGPHETNLLYRYRELLKATTDEEFQIFRAIISGDGLQPGWFWFKDMGEETITRALFAIASQDNSPAVRAGALDTLTAASIRISADLWPSLPLDHESYLVQASAFNYLGALGDEGALSILDEIEAEGNSMLSLRIEETRSRILARLDPTRAFSELISDPYISNDRLQPVLAVVSQIAPEALLKGTHSPSEEIRLTSLKELMRRDRLPPGLAISCTTDPSLKVRAVAFMWLAERGDLSSLDAVREALKNPQEQANTFGGLLAAGLRDSTSPDAESIIVAYLCTRSTEELLSKIDWYTTDGHLAYRALALNRFETCSELIRFDLANGFKRIKEESSRRQEEYYGTEWEDIHRQWEGLDEFIQSLYAESALIGMAKNAQASDAAVIRTYLSQAYTSTRDAAVRVISRIGDPEDAAILSEIAREAHGDVKEQAATAALKLSDAPFNVAIELMSTGPSKLAKIGYDWMLRQDSPEVKDLLMAKLNDADSTDRLRALYYFSERLNGPELEELLKEYIESGPYFYNVVTWLDRLLYSPQPLRTAFAKELERTAS